MESVNRSHIVSDVLGSIPDDADPAAARALARLAVDLQNENCTDPAAALRKMDPQAVVAALVAAAGPDHREQLRRVLALATAMAAQVEKLNSARPVTGATEFVAYDSAVEYANRLVGWLAFIERGGPENTAPGGNG